MCARAWSMKVETSPSTNIYYLVLFLTTINQLKQSIRSFLKVVIEEENGYKLSYLISNTFYHIFAGNQMQRQDEKNKQ